MYVYLKQQAWCQAFLTTVAKLWSKKEGGVLHNHLVLPTPILASPLTNKHSHKKSGEPLLFHLLDHGLFSRSRGLAHHCERVNMSDRAHSGCREPRQAKKGAEGTQDDNEQEIQMEAGAFNQPTLLLTDYQPKMLEEQEENNKMFILVNIFHAHVQNSLQLYIIMACERTK